MKPSMHYMKIIIVSIVDIIIRMRRRDRLQTKGRHNIVQYHKTMSQYIWFTEGVRYAIKTLIWVWPPTHSPTFGSIDPMKPFFFFFFLFFWGGGFPKAFVHFSYLCWKIGPVYCYFLDNGATWRTTEHLSRMKITYELTAVSLPSPQVFYYRFTTLTQDFWVNKLLIQDVFLSQW